MVVKKFEARSMKEALELVKSEMGPEAIIMAAKDNSKRYGLVGEGSVEITAAIKPEQLQKKLLAESRIPANLREKVHRGSAKAHRELIEKAIERNETRVQPRERLEPVQAKSSGPVDRKQRYIDIQDDVEPAVLPNGTNDRLRKEAQKAWREMQEQKASGGSREIHALKEEIEGLREIFKNFKEVPQNIIQGHPGSEFGLKYELASSYEKLLGVGIASPIAVEILKEVQERLPENGAKKSSIIHALIANALIRRIDVTEGNIESKFEVFVGAGGHGKTTSLVKYAADLVLNQQKRVAILTADQQKFGSIEQLKIYAQILNIPFMVINDYSQWEVVSAESGSFDKILIDTPGVRFRIGDEMQKLKELLPPGYLQPHVHLVISAVSKDQDAIEIGKRFSSIGFDDVIFSALDESFQHGVLINFQMALGKPFHSFGTGPRVPEDFERATKERVIDLLLNQGPEQHLNFNFNQDLF
ncbi:MAG: flagellar biosynthesis protein FlhF [Pseudomonadota bacterium]|jgi:flagellar biosynthesis protein FlhF